MKDKELFYRLIYGLSLLKLDILKIDIKTYYNDVVT